MLFPVSYLASIISKLSTKFIYIIYSEHLKYDSQIGHHISERVSDSAFPLHHWDTSHTLSCLGLGFLSMLTDRFCPIPLPSSVPQNITIILFSSVKTQDSVRPDKHKVEGPTKAVLFSPCPPQWLHKSASVVAGCRGVSHSDKIRNSRVMLHQCPAAEKGSSAKTHNNGKLLIQS